MWFIMLLWVIRVILPVWRAQLGLDSLRWPHSPVSWSGDWLVWSDLSRKGSSLFQIICSRLSRASSPWTFTWGVRAAKSSNRRQTILYMTLHHSCYCSIGHSKSHDRVQHHCGRERPKGVTYGQVNKLRVFPTAICPQNRCQRCVLFSLLYGSVHRVSSGWLFQWERRFCGFKFHTPFLCSVIQEQVTLLLPGPVSSPVNWAWVNLLYEVLQKNEWGSVCEAMLFALSFPPVLAALTGVQPQALATGQAEDRVGLGGYPCTEGESFWRWSPRKLGWVPGSQWRQERRRRLCRLQPCSNICV